MFYKKGLRRKNIISLLITTFLTFLIFGCAQAPVKKEVAGIIEEESTQIESIKVISNPSDEVTMIEISSSTAQDLSPMLPLSWFNHYAS
ncbi:MAG: hypothetical protein JRJ57_12225 [Deltaproteobacteria bacterium]|nr:hypothetical protein [Deltaproteobacteria bacterium]